MNVATIRFEGEAFHCVKWAQLLRDMGFRMSGGIHQKAIYASGGNNVVMESHGFVERKEQQGYEWQVTLKQTRRWEGAIKFHAVLLAAFVVPQNAMVTLADKVFTDREALKSHAEGAIIREFALEELIDDGVYRKGDGIQFI
jgi:hypothetical protein